MKRFLPAIGLVLVSTLALSRAAPGPRIEVTPQATNLVLTFQGQLQQAAEVRGPYMPVAGAVSPHVMAAPGSQGFWRSVLVGAKTIAAGQAYTVALRTDGTLWAWGDNFVGQLGNGAFTSTNTPQPILPNQTWQVVAAGAGHTVALRADGTLWTWGANGVGQLGNGMFSTSSPFGTNTPQPILTNQTWQSVAAGYGHTVALRADGTLWTWGRNDYGQLGNGTFRDTNTPQSILSNQTWQAVAAGALHSVALRADGTLWAWGDNYYGQLGNGTNTTSAPYGGLNTPQPILTNQTWQTVAAGALHSVALRADGTLWTWGRNTDGQLGNGTNTTSAPYGLNTPQPILTNQTWQTVAAGDYHTVALRADGTLWAWGENGYGQLGNGTFTDTTNTPQPILISQTWQAVAAGGRHTVALRTDGTLWTWGRDDSGQLGNETFRNASTPKPVLTNETWQGVAAGDYHTVALRADGTLWTWGNNHFGQLGNGTTTNSAPYGLNTPQPILTNQTWQAVAGGFVHTVALQADGTLWAWGDNRNGQLGDDTTNNVSTPQPILSNQTWQAVAAGDYHTVALRADGTLWTWGDNSSGQLGNGTFTRANTPQPIVTNQTWQAVAAGERHTVALRADGMLWTWGDNSAGQLGNGTFRSSNAPQPILTNQTWQAVEAGERHTLALREDGTLWAWGDNGYGQLGNGTFMRTNRPQPILTNQTWQAVTAGANHTVALRANGTLWTWGNNEYRQLGDGSSTSRNTPQPILPNQTWQAVAAGYGHTVALRTDGTLWAWGNNGYGQIAQPVPWIPAPVLGGAVWSTPLP